MEILSPMTEAVKVEDWKQCVKAGRHIPITSEFAQVKWSDEFRLIWCHVYYLTNWWQKYSKSKMRAELLSQCHHPISKR